MENLEILNNDMAARVLSFIQNVDKHNSTKSALLASQNQDGGWGIAQGYESDVMDTALVLKALSSEADIETDVLQKAVSYIMTRQKSNGAWSFCGEGRNLMKLAYMLP